MDRRFSILTALAGACGTPAHSTEHAAYRSAVTVATTPSPRTEPAWVESTKSPWPPASLEQRAAGFTAACGVADGALARVAAKLVHERARGLGAPDPDRVTALLRSHGEPHVRPRIVSASLRMAADDVSLRARLETAKRATTRCGVALARPESGKEGNELFVAIAVDALADLAPLPTRARTGEWLTLDASIRVPATSAKVVVLGPRGLPRTVPTTIDRSSGIVHARFALDRPGAFTVQLVADLATGPEPLLEARIFADVEPPASDEETPTAPGEETASGDNSAALARMTNALRTSESLPPLVRDERLDALALAHADKMRAVRMVAHDLGDGDLALRFESAGLVAKVVSENVARARSVALAHRALHASPSHRLNLLRSEHTHVGIGVVTDEGGDVYVCQVFAAGLR